MGQKLRPSPVKYVLDEKLFAVFPVFFLYFGSIGFQMSG